MIELILLAGGSGSRFCSALPKQFALLKQKPLIHYSLKTFSSIDPIDQIIIACDPGYQDIVTNKPWPKPLVFSPSGRRRQDSLYLALPYLKKSTEYVLVHDAARPFISRNLIMRLIEAGLTYQAATLAVPEKNTIKIGDQKGFSYQTLPRENLWEAQTPQIVQVDLLKKGFAYVTEHDLEVTDDTSVVHMIQQPVKLIESSYDNIKITTPEDLLLAEYILEKKSLYDPLSL